MFCKKCGTEILDELKGCPNCEISAEVEQEIPVQEETIEQQPAVEKIDTDEKNTKGKQKKENTFVRGLLSFLCCLLIFALTVVTLTVFTFRDTIKPEKIESLVESVDIEALAEKGILGETAGAMTPEEIKDIYREGTFDSYIEDTLNDYAGYILKGKKPDAVDGDAVAELVEENSYIIEEVTGDKVDRSYEEIYNTFDNESLQKVLDVEDNIVWVLVGVFTSVYALVAYLVIILGLFLLMLLKVRKRRISTLVWCGITFIIPAVIFAVFGTVRPLTLQLLNGVDPVVSEIVGLYMKNSMWSVIKSSGALMLTGILLIVICVVTKKISKKMSLKANEQQISA